MSTDPGTVVAAGILRAQGIEHADIATADHATLRNWLGRELHPSTIWHPADLDLWNQLPRPGLPLAAWQACEPFDAAIAGRLADALRSALVQAGDQATVSPLHASRYLRLHVKTSADARLLQQLAPIDDFIVVPSLSSNRDDFEWSWPLRIEIADSSQPVVADSWRGALEASMFSGSHYSVTAGGGGGGDEWADIVLVDASRWPHEMATLDGRPPTCVIATGAIAGDDAGELLAELPSRYGAACAIVMPGPPDEWWTLFFEQLCHDIPLDAAALLARPDALVALPLVGADVTAVGRWLLAINDIEPAFQSLVDDRDRFTFAHETGEAAAIAERSRQLTEQTGNRPSVQVEMAMGSVGGDRESIHPGGADSAGPQERRLVADAIAQDEIPIRGSLPPGQDLSLRVKIAVPTEGETVANAPMAFPDEQANRARLEVTVNSDLWDEGQTQEISLPMARDRRHESSTTAVFAFTTPPTGRLVTFDIVVQHNGNLLQSATYVAQAREPGPSPVVPTLTVNSSTGPDVPTPSSSQLGALLDARGAEITDLRRQQRISNANVDDIVSSFELLLSQTLGRSEAPDDIHGAAGTDLIINLARMGSLLNDQLAVFDLSDVPSIGLRINATSPLLPLELAYDGPAPTADAQLCHHVDEPPELPVRCDNLSPSTVCPYGFWGMTTTISRVVEASPIEDPAMARALESIAPTPVLYAAVDLADSGGGRPKPSNRLEKSAKRLFGRVSRVTTWRTWKTKIRNLRPHLLVVLGHTELRDREQKIFIGANQPMSQPDISAELIAVEGETAPIVILMACATARPEVPFASLPGTFALKGARSVIATMSKINGEHGSRAAECLLEELHRSSGSSRRLSEAVASARRQLVAEGLLVGLVLVSHGDVDLILEAQI